MKGRRKVKINVYIFVDAVKLDAMILLMVASLEKLEHLSFMKPNLLIKFIQ